MSFDDETMYRIYKRGMTVSYSTEEVLNKDLEFRKKYSRNCFDTSGFNSFRHELGNISNLEEAKDYALTNFMQFYNFNL